MTYKKYLILYYLLINKNFYDSNKLTINDDKTELLVSYTSTLRNTANNIHFLLISLKQKKESTKILGFTISNNLNHDKYINILISRVNHRIQTFKIISMCMNNKVKIIVMNSLVISLIRYVMLLHINLNNKQIKIIMYQL